MPELELKQVEFAYRERRNVFPVLHQLNLRIPAGEFLCVVGPSGSGKSTLLYLAAGLLKPDRGQILLDGRPLPGPGVDRSVVFQQYSLFPWLTARENVGFGLRQAHKGLKPKEALAQAEQFLAQVEMAEDMDKYPEQLSGGMRQRVAIARALAMDADMLLLDEPFGALDAKKRRDLQDLLENIWQNGQKRRTILFITHDIEEALLLGDRVVFLEQGEIRKDLPIGLPRPRRFLAQTESPQYGKLRQELQGLFLEEAACI